MKPLGALMFLPLFLGSQMRGSHQAHGTRPIAITGVVWDSISGRALSGASVQLVGADPSLAPMSTSSDSLGRFRFAAVAPGTYLLGFFHAALDSLGIEPLPRAVDAGAADRDVVLAGPSPRTIVRTLCGDGVAPDRSSLLLGHLHDAEGEAAIANGSAVVTWSEPRVVGTAVHVDDRSAVATSRRDGWFALCGLPVETVLEVRGQRGADSSGAVAFRLAQNSIRHISLFVGPARGIARLTGRVTGTTGREVAGAQVWIGGTERRTVTNASGAYTLDSVPLGTQAFEVRAISYAPQTVILTLTSALSTRDVVLQQAIVLPTVTTLGAKTSKNLATFEAHKRSSAGGFFVKPARLEGYESLQRLHSLVQGLPNVTVTQTNGEWVAIMKRPSTYIGRSPSVPCAPQMFLNGTKTFLSFDALDSMIDPDDLLGVEVYTREIQIPSVYSLPINQPCGLVSVWTRAPDEKAPKRPE